MDLELRPWQWALLVAWLLWWTAWTGRARAAPLNLRPRRPMRPLTPALIRHPRGQPVRIIIGTPGRWDHVVHTWEGA